MQQLRMMKRALVDHLLSAKWQKLKQAGQLTWLQRVLGRKQSFTMRGEPEIKSSGFHDIPNPERHGQRMFQTKIQINCQGKRSLQLPLATGLSRDLRRDHHSDENIIIMWLHASKKCLKASLWHVASVRVGNKCEPWVLCSVCYCLLIQEV